MFVGQVDVSGLNKRATAVDQLVDGEEWEFFGVSMGDEELLLTVDPGPVREQHLPTVPVTTAVRPSREPMSEALQELMSPSSSGEADEVRPAHRSQKSAQ